MFAKLARSDRFETYGSLNAPPLLNNDRLGVVILEYTKIV